MKSFIVFMMDNFGLIKPVGIIDDYICLMFTKYATDTGSFELQVPFSKSVLSFVKRYYDMEKLILLEDNIVGICHKVNPSITQDERTITIQGSLANGLLDNYCVGKIERLKTATSSPQNILNFPLSLRYVLQNVPDNISGGIWDKIRYTLPSDYTDSSWVFADGYIGGRCSYEKYIQNCVRQLNKCYSLDFDVNDKAFDLNIYTPANRTVNQNTNLQVIISTNLGDILSSQYYLNSKDYKNIVVAYANLEDEYVEQVVTYDSIEEAYDFPNVKKRVAYVEIGDISKYDEQGNELSAEDIAGLLKQKGKQELYNLALVSEYSCKFSEKTTFAFGTDYFLGDKVTIQDDEFNLVLDAEITGYTKTFSGDGEVFEPIIGVPQPSLTRMLKMKGVI